jgi:hypothetical protein
VAGRSAVVIDRPDLDRGRLSGRPFPFRTPAATPRTRSIGDNQPAALLQGLLIDTLGALSSSGWRAFSLSARQESGAP